MNLKTGTVFLFLIATDISQVIIIMLSDSLNFRQSARVLPEMIQLLRWGLIPSWTRNSEDANEIRYKTFNARAESVSSKPSFSKSFKSKRCIIPVKGFFEWQHVGNEKIPWYIYHGSEEIFSYSRLV